MSVNAVPGLAPFQVNTATEATDEERRREQKNKRQGKGPEVAAKPAPEVPGPVTTEVDSSLSRQIVDSEKVIQLLARKASHKKNETVLFLNNLSKKPTPPSANPAPKKVNRVL